RLAELGVLVAVDLRDGPALLARRRPAGLVEELGERPYGEIGDPLVAGQQLLPVRAERRGAARLQSHDRAAARGLRVDRAEGATALGEPVPPAGPGGGAPFPTPVARQQPGPGGPRPPPPASSSARPAARPADGVKLFVKVSGHRRTCGRSPPSGAGRRANQRV